MGPLNLAGGLASSALLSCSFHVSFPSTFSKALHPENTAQLPCYPKCWHFWKHSLKAITEMKTLLHVPSLSQSEKSHQTCKPSILPTSSYKYGSTSIHNFIATMPFAYHRSLNTCHVLVIKFKPFCPRLHGNCASHGCPGLGTADGARLAALTDTVSCRVTEWAGTAAGWAKQNTYMFPLSVTMDFPMSSPSLGLLLLLSPERGAGTNLSAGRKLQESYTLLGSACTDQRPYSPAQFTGNALLQNMNKGHFTRCSVPWCWLRKSVNYLFKSMQMSSLITCSRIPLQPKCFAGPGPWYKMHKARASVQHTEGFWLNSSDGEEAGRSVAFIQHPPQFTIYLP